MAKKINPIELLNKLMEDEQLCDLELADKLLFSVHPLRLILKGNDIDAHQLSYILNGLDYKLVCVPKDTKLDDKSYEIL